MSNRYIAAIGEITLPSDENDWLPHKDFTKAKELWQKSNDDQSNSDYLKACSLVQKHIHAKFSKSTMINHFANKVADVDEDGWSNVSAENIIYGKRKSVFKKYNDATYEDEEIDSIIVSNIDFYERDYDDEPIESSICDSPTLSFILLKNTDLKDEYSNQTDIVKWEEKNDFELLECFSLEINENTCSYIDEDGYEGSGYSMQGGTTQTFLNEKGETLKSFSSRLKDIFAYGTAESIEIDDNIQSFFEHLSNGNLDNIKSYINENNTNVNLPLVDGVDVTKPLSIVFSAAFFEKDVFKQIFGQIFNLEEFKKINKDGLKESIFYLAAQGADLQQKISNLSYLSISINIDPEITEFLLSFGFNPERDSDVLSLACEKGNLNLVEKFIDLGAKVDPDGNGTSPLLYAAQGESEEKTLSKNKQKEHIKIIERLIKEGAKINHIDEGGDTALTNAVRCNNEEIVKYLINEGANVNALKVKNAQVPIKIASDKKFNNLVEILKSAGANEINLLPKGKKECPDCKKAFAESTLKKWNGTCGSCYRKKNPRPKTKNTKKPTKKSKSTYSNANQSTGCVDSADGCFDTMDAFVDLVKMLAILGFVLYFVVAIIWALFTS